MSLADFLTDPFAVMDSRKQLNWDSPVRISQVSCCSYRYPPSPITPGSSQCRVGSCWRWAVTQSPTPWCWLHHLWQAGHFQVV